MSNNSPPAPTPPNSGSPETTFRNFTPGQSANYASIRQDYHPSLYSLVLTHHTSTGGQLNSILDVGCGPGTAVSTLAPTFSHATAIDPSEGMLTTARALHPNAGIRFAVSTAEALGADLAPPIPDRSVDLLTAATAAHWFDMARFWARAAAVVKPGGTVAIWAGGRIAVGQGVPNREKVQRAIDAVEENVEEYMVEGNRIARGLYRDLAMPWDGLGAGAAAGCWERETFVRREWGTDEDSLPGSEFYARIQEITLDMLEKAIGTASPVIRWREANPDAVGTALDPVKIMRRDVEAAFREVGVDQGKEVLDGGVSGVLLLVKRKTEGQEPGI